LPQIARPSTITFLPLELTTIVSVPERDEPKRATVMSFRLTGDEEYKLTVLRSVEPQ
jgi:hypothetical protein